MILWRQSIRKRQIYPPVALVTLQRKSLALGFAQKILGGHRPWGAETQLEHARLVSEIVAERGLTIVRIVYVSGIGAVVRVIEQIEHLEHAEELHTVTNRDPLLKPHVHAVDRQPRKAVARQDRAIARVALQGDGTSARLVTKVGAEHGSETLA